jgi:hypothetical protein
MSTTAAIMMPLPPLRVSTRLTTPGCVELAAL